MRTSIFSIFIGLLFSLFLNPLTAEAQISNTTSANGQHNSVEAANLFFPNRYSAVFLANTYNWGEIVLLKPTWFIIENKQDGYLSIIGGKLNCKGQVSFIPKNQLKDVGQRRQPVINNKAAKYEIGNYSQSTQAPPFSILFKMPKDCGDAQLKIFPNSYYLKRQRRNAWNFSPEYLQTVSRPDLSINTSVSRIIPIESLKARNLTTALEEAKYKFKEYLISEGGDYLEDFENDTTDIELIEFRDWVGKNPLLKIKGRDFFRTSINGVSLENNKQYTIQKSSKPYSNVKRIGEALITETINDRNEHEVILVAPYPYGETATEGLIGALLGANVNTYRSVDRYYQRQRIICTASNRKSKISTIKYIGPIEFATAPKSGPCSFEDDYTIKTIFAAYQKIDQPRTLRQTNLEALSGVSRGRITAPCGDKSTYIIHNNDMKLRSQQIGCDKKSEPEDNLNKTSVGTFIEDFFRLSEKK